MNRPPLQKWGTFAAVFLGVWLFFRYLLPLCAPFLLGALLAAAAEKPVAFLQKRLRFRRGAAVAVGVTAVLLAALGVLTLLGALALREMRRLGDALPALEEPALQGLATLEDWLLTLADRAPDALRTPLMTAITELFSDGSAFFTRLTRWLLQRTTGLLQRLPDSALSFGTCLLSAYMFSAKGPAIAAFARQRLPELWKKKYLPVLQSVRRGVCGWLTAQSKLAAVVFAEAAVAFFLLGIPYAPLIAAAVALVDAAPLLGTGTVLVPWSAVCLLQGKPLRGAGLLALYLAASLTRSALEPRLVGRQLGLDPLVTLGAMYAGYRLLGIGGMIVSPLIAVIALQIVTETAK